MIKTFGLTTIVASVLLTGCGGGGSKSATEKITDKKYVIIFESVESGICEASSFRDTLKNKGFESFISQETSTNTSCSTYGKRNDGNECATEYIGEGNKNCVIGFNSINGQGKQMKVVENTNLYDNTEILSSKF